VEAIPLPVISKNDKQRDTPLTPYQKMHFHYELFSTRLFCTLKLELLTKSYYNRTWKKSSVKPTSKNFTFISKALQLPENCLNNPFCFHLHVKICCHFEDVVNKHNMIVEKLICAENFF